MGNHVRRLTVFRALTRAVFVFWALAGARPAWAASQTVALYLDGPAPDVAALRPIVVAALPQGSSVADEKAFRARVTREPKKRALAHDPLASRIDRLRAAARALSIDLVVFARVQRGKRSREVDLLVVDAHDGPPATEKVALEPRSRRLDAERVTQALDRAVATASPPPPSPPEPTSAAPEPSPETPPAPAQATEGATVVNESPPPVASGAAANVDRGPAPGRATSLVELSIELGAGARRFAYANGILGGPRVQTDIGVPDVRLAGAVYPLARLRSAASDFGIFASYERMFLRTNTVNTFLADVSPTEYAVGVRARIHPGREPKVILGISAAYVLTAFGAIGPQSSDLPDVAYRSLRPGLDLAVALGRVVLSAGGGYRFAVDNGAISTRFYSPRGFGWDAELGVGLRVRPSVELRLGVRAVSYAFSLTAPPGTLFGNGRAQDESADVGLGVSFFF